MGIAPETKLIVKHTFLEFVQDSPTLKGLRVRAQTDSALACGLSDNEVVSPASARSTTLADENSSVEQCDFSDGDVQPEWPSAGFTGAQFPAMLHAPYSIAETVVPWVPCYDASVWGSTDAWWIPTGHEAECQPDNVQEASVQQDSTSWDTLGTTKQNSRSSSEDCNTTVMLRNLPNNYTREMLLDLVDSEGFARQYDFVYLPIDFNSQAGLGYGFVNLLSPAIAQRFWEHFDGFCSWAMPSDKVCSLNWSTPHQGLEAHIERYRNSPVMHEAVADECKPMLFANGVRIRFPRPTKQLKAPRLRVRDSAKNLHR